jgi:hypothetical protein
VLASTLLFPGPAALANDAFSIRVHGGMGFYAMSDVVALKDAWIEDAPYSASEREGVTLAVGGEPSVYVDVAEFRGWILGLGSGWMGDTATVEWHVPTDPVPGWPDFGDRYAYAEFRVECRTLELSGTRYWPVLSNIPDSAFFRVNVGLAWASMHGKAEYVSVDDDAIAPLIQIGVGVKMGELWFFRPTLEAGIRYLRPSFGYNDESPVTAMDEDLLDFLDTGAADFSGFYVNIGLIFFD